MDIHVHCKSLCQTGNLLDGKHKIWSQLFFAFENDETCFLPTRHLFNNVFANPNTIYSNKSNISQIVVRQNHLTASASLSTRINEWWTAVTFRRNIVFLVPLFEKCSRICNYMHFANHTNHVTADYKIESGTKEHIWALEEKFKYSMNFYDPRYNFSSNNSNEKGPNVHFSPNYKGQLYGTRSVWCNIKN